MNTTGKVIAVCKSKEHKFGKDAQNAIQLIEGLGIEGDCHSGTTNQHLYAMRKFPEQVNLRQVHLIHQELFAQLAEEGFTVLPGQLGENITTSGIDLLNLPKNTILKFGNTASIQITGLREPCSQINSIKKGLMKAMITKDENGGVTYKTGVMAIVNESGEIKAGDSIEIILPAAPHQKLECV